MSTESLTSANTAPAPSTTDRILRVGPVNPTVAAALKEDYEALVLPDGTDRDAFLTEHGAEITIAVCSGKVGLDHSLLTQLPRLDAIINFGVGFDATDVAEVQRRGIQMSNTPDVLTDCVADTALALYLDVLRRISAADRFVRAGQWIPGTNFPLTTRATGRRVGILGLGRIGQAIATRLEGFGAELHYHNRRERPESSYQYHATAVDLAENVEVLIVAAAGGPESAGLVSREVLQALGHSGYLINIARGSVVDEDALVSLLHSGGLAGAGLDVFADEPHVPAELKTLDNVVLLPHLGSGTVETRADMAELALNNLREWLTHRRLVTPIF